MPDWTGPSAHALNLSSHSCVSASPAQPLLHMLDCGGPSAHEVYLRKRNAYAVANVRARFRRHFYA